MSVDLSGIPPKVFFYTIDQLAYMLAMSEQAVMGKLWIGGGSAPRDKMKAVNIGGTDNRELRVEDKEFRRWCRNMGISIPLR